MSFRGDSDIRKAAETERKRVAGGWVDGFALGLATCGGAGRCPLAPGTFGSLLGIPVSFLLGIQPPGVQILSFLALLAMGMWAADRAEALMGRKDPPEVVVDEVLGMVVALAWIPHGLGATALGVLLFRVFDILKVQPARWAERKLPGGVGVVVDDLVAGLYANACLRVVLALLGR